VALYDAEIFGMDRAMGDFIDWLGLEGLLDNTHVIVTGDHGEQFMEHGATGHGTLWEETVRVPLVWMGPNVHQGRRIDRFAGLVDIAPTLAELLGRDVDQLAFQGRSLVPFLVESSVDIPWDDRVLLEGPHRERLEGDTRPRSRLARALVTPGKKVLARDCEPGKPGAASVEVFDLVVDPTRRRKSWVDRPATDLDAGAGEVAAFFEHAEQAILSLEGSSSRHSVGLSEEMRLQLEALGYVDEPDPEDSPPSQ
jgi:hypothetical protein